MVAVIVAVTDAYLPRIDEVRGSLEANGLIDAEVFETLGVIGGTVAEENWMKLVDVPGVISVEEERQSFAYVNPS